MKRWKGNGLQSILCVFVHLPAPAWEIVIHRKRLKRTANKHTNILRNFIKLQNSDHTLIELSLSCVWVKTIRQCVSSDLIAVFQIGWSTNRLWSAIDSRLRGYEWTKQENALVSFSIHVCVCVCARARRRPRILNRATSNIRTCV